MNRSARKKLIVAIIVTCIMCIFFLIYILPEFDGILNKNIAASDFRANLDCRENLRTIYSALKLYYYDHSCYPQKLVTLEKLGYISPQNMKCPLFNREKRLSVNIIHDKGNVQDYDYFPPLKVISENNNIEETKILCADKPNNHIKKDVPHNINVLYTNGVIRSWNKDIATGKFTNNGDPWFATPDN